MTSANGAKCFILETSNTAILITPQIKPKWTIISRALQGTLTYKPRLRTKGGLALAKLESSHIHSGHLVRPKQTEKYYKTTVLAVIKANVSAHQLDDSKGGVPGYEAARRITAKVLRRMLATSSRTAPTLLILEAGWDLPDREIIEDKLRFHARMAQRVYNEKKRRKEYEIKDQGCQDYPTHVWTTRVAQVEQGETLGICAEAKRLWSEAGMQRCWPPDTRKNTYARSDENIKMAAETIGLTRLIEQIDIRTKMNGETPYDVLYDGTTWRITNGTRKEVGLMTSARLGALLTNAGRASDREEIDPWCACCRDGTDTAKHMLIQCEAMDAPRSQLWQMTENIWTTTQREEFENSSHHEKYMKLLGKQFTATLSMKQQKLLDRAVKHTLVNMDDLRRRVYGMQPLAGTKYTKPPQRTAQLLEQWRRMDDGMKTLRTQQMGSDEDSETDSEDDRSDSDEGV